MSQVEYKLGLELQLDKDKYRIIRIVERSYSLHREEGKEYILEESYVELKSQTGEIEFVVLSSDKKPYTGPPSSVVAPAPIPWVKGES